MSRPISTTQYPAFVAFFAYLSSDYRVLNAHRPIVFDKTVSNFGSAYHTSSGNFVAPRSGIYVFTWTIRLNTDSVHTTELVVQNEIVNSVYFSPQNHVDGSVSGTVVVYMNANDDALIRTGPIYHNGIIRSDVNGKSSFWVDYTKSVKQQIKSCSDISFRMFVALKLT